MASCFHFDIDVWGIIRMIIAGIGLIITIIVGGVGIRQFRNMKKKLYPALRYLFYLSIMASAIRCICIMFAYTACICNGTRLFAYYVLLLSLLGTQLVRLKHTFQNTVYSLSRLKQYLLGISFIVTLIAFSLSITFIVYMISFLEVWYSLS